MRVPPGLVFVLRDRNELQANCHTTAYSQSVKPRRSHAINPVDERSTSNPEEPPVVAFDSRITVPGWLAAYSPSAQLEIPLHSGETETHVPCGISSRMHGGARTLLPIWLRMGSTPIQAMLPIARDAPDRVSYDTVA